MAFGTLIKDGQGTIPIAQVYIPGVGFVALQGANSSTDGSGNASAVVALGRSATVVLNQGSAAQTSNGNSGDLTVGPFDQIAIDINMTANSGTSQTLTFFWDRKGIDGIYYPIWQSALQTIVNQQISTSIGVGMAYNQSLGSTGRLRWVITGTTPSYTFSASIIGK